jgi:hypothetical protein
MLRHLTVAAALATIMAATAARAAVISGTWSFEVHAWPIFASPFNPPAPVTGSATFSFDNGESSASDVPVPGGNFTSNSDSPSATYSYNQSSDSLELNFAGSGFIEIQAQFIDVSTRFIEPGVPPTLQQYFSYRPWMCKSPRLTFQAASHPRSPNRQHGSCCS